MSRLVTHDADSPLKLDAEDIDAEKGDVAICRCGLSASSPFCDGTHRETRNEADETLYRYAVDESDAEHDESDAEHDESDDAGENGNVNDGNLNDEDDADGSSRRVVERIVYADE